MFVKLTFSHDMDIQTYTALHSNIFERIKY